MPTYEYACSECGHRFDVRQSFNDEPLRDCPQCGASVHRVIYASGVIFKGSGWYINDSRSGSQASHSDAPKPAKDKDATPTTGDSATSAKTSNGSSSESSTASASPSTSETKTPAKSAADD